VQLAAAGDWLYLTQGGVLRRIDPANGQGEVISGSNWGGTTSLSAFDGALYAVQADTLQRVDVNATQPWSNYQNLGTVGNWAGPTSSASIGNNLYIVQNARLHRVDPATGNYTVINDTDWSGTTAMTALGNRLYIIQGGILQRVNPDDGTYTKLRPDVGWDGPAEMTALGDSLYVIQNGTLHRVDPATGNYVKLGSVWAGTTSMTALDNELYAIQDNTLYAVNPDNGHYKALGRSVWSGATRMTVDDGSLFVIQDGHLHRVDPTNGSYRPISEDIWDNTTSLTTLADNLYAVQNGALQRIDVSVTRPWSNYEKLGIDGDWSGPTASAVLNGQLYVIQDATLHRVQADGHYVKVGGAWYPGHVQLAAAGDWLFLTQGGILRRIDPATGQGDVISDANWNDTTWLTAVGDQIYAVQNGTLQHIDVSVTRPWSNYEKLGIEGDWGGPTASAMLNGQLYVIQDATLHRVQADGHYVKVGGAWYPGDVQLAAAGDWLYLTQGGVLRRIDPATGRGDIVTGTIWGGKVSVAGVGDQFYAVQNSAPPLVETAVVSANFPGNGSSTGNVVLSSDGGASTALASSGGHATHSPGPQTTGSQTVTPSDGGNTLFSDSTAVPSVTVTPATRPAAAMSLPDAPVSSGNAVQQAGTMARHDGSKPSGTGSFLDGTTTLASGAIPNGSIRGTFVSTTLTAGKPIITARRSGRSMFIASKSPIVIRQPVPKAVDTRSAASRDAQGFQATTAVNTTTVVSSDTPTSSSEGSTWTKPPSSSGLSSSGVDGYFSSISGSRSSPRALAGALAHGHAGDDWLRQFCLELWRGMD
jgi:hypothetical protein